jgi:predicted ribosome quality control (RQC) complex YloA/Tae2 family protein
MDYFYLDALIRQIRPGLQGALVNKIYQPQADTLVFKLWNGRQEVRLLMRLGAAHSSMYLTEQSYRNPLRPPRFCQLLRARLHRLDAIQLDKADRIVSLRFSGKEGQPYTLLATFFGRDANLSLLDERQQLIDSLHRHHGQPSHVDPDSTDTIALGDLATWLRLHGEPDGVSSFLIERVVPMSHSLAASLVKEAGEHPLVEIVERFVAAWQQDRLKPRCQGKRLSMWLQGDDSAAADLSRFASQQAQDSGPDDLSKVVKKALKRLQKRLTSIDAQWQECEQADLYRQQADLLSAQRHLLKRGMADVEVVDYYQDPPVSCRLPLDPAKTPQDNIDRYYKRYSKAKRGLDHCLRRHEQTEQEIAWLEEIAEQLDQESARDHDLIRQELIDAAIYRPQNTLNRETRRTSPADLVRRCHSPGGWSVMWGRNNKTNDYLSKHLLKSGDLWFHAHNLPGSHVVLKCDGAEVAEEDVLFAAAIAARYCRGKNNAKVDVMVTRGKQVKRVKNAPPGLVTVDEYRTVVVAPAESVNEE